jgi:hypothetical protein
MASTRLGRTRQRKVLAVADQLSMPWQDSSVDVSKMYDTRSSHMLSTCEEATIEALMLLPFTPTKLAKSHATTYAVGIMYMDQIVSNPMSSRTTIPADILDALHTAANNGHADTELLLGLCYVNGAHCIPRDVTFGISLLHRAARRGNRLATFCLTQYYTSNAGIYGVEAGYIGNGNM